MGNGSSRPEVSVVIPALNEEGNIAGAVRSAKCDRGCEIIVVDGGSADGTARAARRAGAKVVSSPTGRARQLNAGAARALGDTLVFLHADSQLPEGWERGVRGARARRQWGCFETISIDADPVTAWILRHCVALRTRLLHRPYGDQALFVSREAFKRSGGFPEWPLLEDLALVKTLRRQCGPPGVVPRPVRTSGRRWQALGLVQTTLINQTILIGFAMGTDVHKLADWYARTGPRQRWRPEPTENA